ncbi:amyloid fiber anchoring/assembly protein TapA [Bacillus sp. ISL-45]|uniref:amyloid fiber anchoring/assembly protein TapA n=1 Tax=Bacillus sp. ISL-45 TaxID=2819128 RepID=UPI001BE9282D|nr:amyloid fiber anchoring/assembly protein TapA [Bacillus sp. ISL-45]MBT2663893.1 amyloid fiber anchoring/assembly protein TapA [Bacillus sp. ISL-45]
MRKTITNFVLKLIHKRKAEWEGSIIRSSRLRKFKKRSKGISIAAQIIAIWYLFILAGSYLTSYTGAYFNDIETIENFLGAADEFPGEPDEWDRSSLSFTNVGGFCTQGFEGKLYSELANVGDEDMEGPTTFYIYKKTQGSPNRNDPGELVHKGEVPPIEGKDSPNNKTILVFSPDLSTMTPGKYKFKADQRPGHSNPNNNQDVDREQETWGEEITVTQADIDSCKVTSPAQQEPPEETQTISEIEGLTETHTSNSITLNWSNPIENFSHVNIYRNGQLLEDNISGNSYEDKGLTPSSEYEYKIIVVDESGVETNGVKITVSTDAEIVEDKIPPSAVTNTSLTRNGESPNITLVWQNPGDEDFSHVKIYKDDVLIQEKFEGTEYLDETSEVNHNYKIVTVDKSGNESVGVEVTVSTID